MTATFDRDRLVELAAALCDERITDSEFAELDVLLGSSSEARQLYHVMVATHQVIAFTHADEFEALLAGQEAGVRRQATEGRRACEGRDRGR